MNVGQCQLDTDLRTSRLLGPCLSPSIDFCCLQPLLPVTDNLAQTLVFIFPSRGEIEC